MNHCESQDAQGSGHQGSGHQVLLRFPPGASTVPPHVTPSKPWVADFARIRCSHSALVDPEGLGDNKAAGGTLGSGVLAGDVPGGKGCVQVILSSDRSQWETWNQVWARRIADRAGAPSARRLSGTLVAGQESVPGFASTPGLSFPPREGVHLRGCRDLGGCRVGPAAGCGVWWPRVPSVAGRGGRARDQGPACAGRVASPEGALPWPDRLPRLAKDLHRLQLRRCYHCNAGGVYLEERPILPQRIGRRTPL